MNITDASLPPDTSQFGEFSSRLEDQAQAIMVIANKVNDRLTVLEAKASQLLATGGGNDAKAAAGARDALIARSEVKSLKVKQREKLNASLMHVPRTSPRFHPSPLSIHPSR